jgi:tetratricopeptide (TPR) repeat protein
VQLPAATDKDRLQLARFYSWNKQLASAISTYEDYLSRHGDDDQVRLELARNLSWTGRYAESEASYSQLLEKHPEERETRLGLARVLSWDKKYTESLKQYAILHEKYPDDREVGIEQARVNSWSGDFARALRLYNRILAKHPKDRDALLGKAQVLTWTGRAPEALPILDPLHKKYPQDRDVALVWASAQQSVGRPDVALATLDQLNMIDPTNRDVRNLMESVKRSLRPELSINFGSALDSDHLHTYLFKATYSFNTGARMRSFVSLAGIPSSAPSAGEFNAQEFAYGFSARVHPRLEVRMDGGLSHLSTGRNDFVGGAGFSLYPMSRLKVAFDFSQRAINGLPSAVPSDITRYGPAAALRFDFDRKTSLDVDAFHYQYSDTNTQNGGDLSFVRRLWGGEGKGLAVGYLFAYSGFTRDISSGFFAPRRYQRHAAQLNFDGRFTKRFAYSFYGTLGKEKFAMAATPVDQIRFHRDGTATLGLSYEINDKTSMGVSYSYLDLAPPGGSGAYRTNGVSAFTRIRF